MTKYQPNWTGQSFCTETRASAYSVILVALVVAVKPCAVVQYQNINCMMLLASKLTIEGNYIVSALPDLQEYSRIKLVTNLKQ